jgi:Ca2+-binding EF-hand superfamily protein
MNVEAIGGMGMNAMGMMRRPSVEDMSLNAMNDMDGNGDEVLTIDETQFSEDMFAEIDADGDGELSLDEIQSDMESRHEDMLMQLNSNMGMIKMLQNNSNMGMNGSGMEDMFSHLMNYDVNNDQSVSSDEFKGPEELFGQIDSDGDGLLSQEEIIADIESKHDNMLEHLNPNMSKARVMMGGMGGTEDSDGDAVDELLESLFSNDNDSEESNE